MRRRFAPWVMFLASGCCVGGASEPAPVATTVVASAPVLDPACLGLCERLAACDRDEGRTPSAPDCSAGCSEGGAYATLDRTMLTCAEQPSCDAARRCAAPGLAMALLGAIASGAPTTPPPEWPAGFPAVPGGIARPAPTMGPVRVALVAYPGRDVPAVVGAYRDALTVAGWTLTDAPAGDGEAIRFVASHASESVSVSIYRDGTDAVVQTMQLGATPGTP